MPKQNTYIFDGVKAVPPWDFENDKGWTSLTGDVVLQSIDLYFQRVPWLFRSVRDRANNVSHMPWYFVTGEKDYDSLDGYQNKLGWLPKPRRLLHLVEQSICVVGRAYLFLETNNSGYIKGIKYCNPYSVREVIVDGMVTGYKRREGTQEKQYPTSNFVAVYDPDYLTEIGPGKTSAAGAALLAAGLLYNSTGFATQFFKRGAIKATVLTAEKASQPEAERLQSWWEDVVQGVKNAWSAIVLRSEAVKATTIGEGLESLQNEVLTKEQRQEIAAAMGVPESRMWSAAANYATREMDELAYFNGTIIPECDLIAEAFNEQAFTKEHHLDNIRMEARPDTLDIFQADNANQANAYQAYVNAGMKQSVAAQILGIELPEGMEYEDLDPEDEPQPETQPENEPVTLPEPAAAPVTELSPTETTATPQEMRTILKAWKRKAEFALKESGNALCEFETHIIPLFMQEAIKASLSVAQTNEDIAACMEFSLEEETPAEVKKEIDRWRRKALNAVKNGKPANVDFSTTIIPDEMCTTITSALGKATSEEDVKQAFEQSAVITKPGEFDEVIVALREAVKALDNEPEKPA